MSIAKVEYVKAARKDQGKCEHDGTPIPVGAAYRWFTVGFRSKWKHVRCMNAQCTPKRSDPESSLLAGVWAGQEGAEADLATLAAAAAGDPADAVQQATEALGIMRDAMDEVVQQYRDQDENFGGGGNTDSAERADTLEAARDELDQWVPDETEPEGCEDHGGEGWQEDCEQCAANWDTWLEGLVASAQDALDTVEV